MSNVLNFGAGPAKIPQAVLKKAQHEFLDWHGSGMSVMELSHRSKEFESIIRKAEKDLRDLLNIPQNYKVIFLQGGGNTQFSSVPLNLLGKIDAPVDYIVTGTWSEKAAKEAKRYSRNVNIINCKTEEGYVSISDPSTWKLTEDASYFYYCSNETIDGVEFPFVPQVNVPLVCDMSSNILSKEIDVSKYALIYAGAQKNIGPAGLTIVIVREDFLGKSLDITPIMLDYKINSDNGSLYNTPPTYSVYMAGLVFEWMKEESQGGVAGIQKINEKKAKQVYDAIENSNGFYKCSVRPECRSRMNVTFRIYNPKTGKKDEQLEKKFLEESEKQKMVQLAGHRSVGGIRASLYNAMEYEGAVALTVFLKKFMEENTQTN